MSTTTQDLNTLFSQAIEKDENEAIRLLAQNPDLATINVQEIPILVFSASRQRWKLLQELIKNQKNIDIAPEQGPLKGITALWYVVYFDQWDLMKHMIALGARNFDVALPEGPNKGITVLWYTVVYKPIWKHVIKQMINHGARSFDIAPEQGPDTGLTTLWYAIYYRELDLAKRMVELGAKSFDVAAVQGQDKGKTALWFAVFYREWELVEQMIELGARNFDTAPEQGLDKGETVLLAVASWHKLNLLKRMIELGARSFDVAFRQRPNEGKTVLWYAAYLQLWDLVERMIELKAQNFDAAPTDDRDKGLTILWFAAANKQWDLVERMIKRGARSFEAARMEGVEQGKTVLWYAAEHQKISLFKKMLSFGASIDVFDVHSIQDSSIIDYIKRIKNLFNLLSNRKSTKEKLQSEIEVIFSVSKSFLNGRYQKKVPLQVAIENDHEDAIYSLLKKDVNLFLINKDIFWHEYQSNIIIIIIKMNQLKNRIETHIAASNLNLLAENTCSSTEQEDKKEGKEVKQYSDGNSEKIDDLIKKIIDLCTSENKDYQSMLYFEFAKQLMQIFSQVNKEVLLKILNSISNKIGKKKYEKTQSFLALTKYELYKNSLESSEVNKPRIKGLDEDEEPGEDNQDTSVNKKNTDALIEIFLHLSNSGKFADKNLLSAIAVSLVDNSSYPTKLYGIDPKDSCEDIKNKIMLFLFNRNRKENSSLKRKKEHKESKMQALNSASATTSSTIVSFSASASCVSSSSIGSITLPASAASLRTSFPSS